MQTRSYISAAALSAALLIGSPAAQAQLLGVDVDLDVLGVEADADVEVGGDSLLDADVDVGTDGSTQTTPASDSSDSLVDVDVDLGDSPATGPNGGTLIDLNVGGPNNAVLDAEVDLLDGGAPSAGSNLITGDIRIAALSQDARKDALLALIDHPQLANVDLDAAIDDRRVAVVAVVDLLGEDSLADIRAAIDLGGAGRSELLDALDASVEVKAILDQEGIDINDVLAVQIAEDGATELIVLDGLVDVALLGDGNDLPGLAAEDLARLDIDLLSRDELAAIDLDLLPEDLRSTVQLRLLGSDSDDAELTPAELAEIDLDLLSDEELAELDVALLPEPLGAAVNLRLLGENALADSSLADLANLDLDLIPASNGEPGGNTGGTSTGGTGTGGGDEDGATPGTDTTTTGSTSGRDGDGTGSTGTPQASGGLPKPVTGTPSLAANSAAPAPAPAAPVFGAMPPTQVNAGFDIATLGCDIGVLALASGAEATPQAIAGADTLELVRIDGCERSLVDSAVETIRAAIARNPAISDVLEDAAIPLDQVIGATIQDETLTLFLAPTIS